MTQQALIIFFQNIANKDPALLDSLEVDPSFALDEKSWVFTLPNLHMFLQSQDDTFVTISYKSFRKLIFSCKINSELKPLGAEITIYNNKNNVDLSSYKLAWSNQEVAD